MRYEDERGWAGKCLRATKGNLGLIAVLALAGCAGADANRAVAWPATADANGPQADYPVVIGEPYAIGSTAFTPADVLNYDEVGVAVADVAGGEGISAAHHTLPLPSYVEVTSLDSGRTALVRVERRGPMDSTALIALSPGASAQMAIAPDTPVRVRRVNPPEDQRALLRAGTAAPLRMDTPMSLVEVLRRKLPERAIAVDQEEVNAAAARAGKAEDSVAQAEITPLPIADDFDTSFAPTARQDTAPHPSGSAHTGFMVQAAAFSTAERARRAADVLAGTVSQSGAYYRVRTGPFATRAEAEAALAKVRDAGYSDARIFTNG